MTITCIAPGHTVLLAVFMQLDLLCVESELYLLVFYQSKPHIRVR